MTSARAQNDARNTSTHQPTNQGLLRMVRREGELQKTIDKVQARR